MVSGKQRGESGNVVICPLRIAAAGWRRSKQVLRQDAGKEVVHAGFRVTDRHCPAGVAMITATDRQQPLLRRLTGRLPVLDGQLDRHLDADRTGIAEEHAL